MRTWATVAMVMLSAFSCGEGSGYPGAAPTVDVTMREYAYDYEPAIESGRTVFRTTNRGALPHEFVLIFLPPEVPPIKTQLTSPDRQIVATVATFHARPAGGTGTIAVDLDPGRYAFVCFVTDADGGQHAQKGMAREFLVE